jgi:diaminohydroxyphosphoribosylaminopyrimidine deaminase/5-amino-6-(5-phosphoribosylamino)uracil reductase
VAAPPAAGVARVVAALPDPEPRVAGAGIAHRRDPGGPVDVGVHAEPVARDLMPYLVHRREGRAATLVKLATSLDGRTAAADGSSRWITGPAARADGHRLRGDSQAVLVGSGTALADRPALTARDAQPAPEHQPLRVLLDGRGRVPAAGPLFDGALAPTLVITTPAAPDAAVSAWLAAGAKVQVVAAGARGRGVDLRAALEVLGGLGVLQVLVEGGAEVAGSLLEEGLVDRLVTYVAPTVLGARGRPALDVAGAATMADAERWRLVDVERLDDDVRLEYAPVPGAGER